MKNPPALREIDRVVDQMIEDKGRAAKLKSVLHQQYDLTRPDKSGKVKTISGFSDDAEDFWDNVPI